jgi:cellulose synthase/poly-beta-1,6-N-acetylglucosamine synthase-like glycosyltransferase
MVNLAAMASPPAISIVIPTRRRPQSLARAMRSAVAQSDVNTSGVDPARLELVVADNDPEGSARAAVEALRAEAPFAVIYAHEPRAGVANARNAALAVASGALIAFLDDDEEAPPGWLAALVDAQARFGADAVFGPVRGRAPAGPLAHRAYLESFFSRHGPDEAGRIDLYYGCGCSLVRRAALPDPVAPFSPARNHTGGEDDLLFGAMQAAGAVFAWAPDAWVWEDPVPERLSLGYAISRAFVYGQGPTYQCATAEPRDVAGVVRWMAIGALQASVFGGLAALQWLVGAERRAFTLDRAARGLGKVLWWGPFKLRLYGRSISPQTAS